MLIALLIIVLAIVVSMVVQIDDWSRDLSINHAATSLDAADPTLRSLELKASPDDVKAAIRRYAENSSAWSENQSLKNNEAALALVRTTRLFRFADDVEVFLQPTETGTRVDLTSQSRVGKGDLGQNPRNLRELLDALREELE